MGHDQRQRVGLGRAHVQQMHRLAGAGGEELRVLVEAGLPLPPVVVMPPTVEERFDDRPGQPVVAADAGQTFGQPGAGQAPLEVVEVALGHRNLERTHNLTLPLDLKRPWRRPCPRPTSTW